MQPLQKHKRNHNSDSTKQFTAYLHNLSEQFDQLCVGLSKSALALQSKITFPNGLKSSDARTLIPASRSAQLNKDPLF